MRFENPSKGRVSKSSWICKGARLRRNYFSCNLTGNNCVHCYISVNNCSMSSMVKFRDGGAVFSCSPIFNPNLETIIKFKCIKTVIGLHWPIICVCSFSRDFFKAKKSQLNQKLLGGLSPFIHSGSAVPEAAQNLQWNVLRVWLTMLLLSDDKACFHPSIYVIIHVTVQHPSTYTIRNHLDGSKDPWE